MVGWNEGVMDDFYMHKIKPLSMLNYSLTSNLLSSWEYHFQSRREAENNAQLYIKIDRKCLDNLQLLLQFSYKIM